MKKQTKNKSQRRKFAAEYVANGGNGSRAALAAGAGNNPNTAASIAVRLLKEKSVQDHIAKLQDEVERSGVMTAVYKRQKCLEIVLGGHSPKDKIAAMQEDSKLAGHYAPVKSDVTSEGKSIGAVLILPPNQIEELT